MEVLHVLAESSVRMLIGKNQLLDVCSSKLIFDAWSFISAVRCSVMDPQENAFNPIFT